MCESTANQTTRAQFPHGSGSIQLKRSLVAESRICFGSQKAQLEAQSIDAHAQVRAWPVQRLENHTSQESGEHTADRKLPGDSRH